MKLIAPENANKLTVPLLMLTACSSMPQATVLTPFLNEFASDMGVSVGTAGQIGTAQSVGAFVAAVLMVPFIQQLSLKPLLVLACLGISVTSVLTGLINNYPTVMALRVITGLPASLMVSGSLAAVGRSWLDPQERNKRSGFVVGALAVAPGLLTPAFRAIGDFYSWQVSIMAMGGLSAGTAVLLILMLPHMPGNKATGAVKLRQRLSDAWRVAFNPMFKHVLSARFLSWATLGSAYIYLAAFFIAKYPGREMWIGPLFASGAVAFMAASFASGYLFRKLGGPVRSIPIVTGLVTVLMLCYAWLTLSPTATLAFWCIASIGVGLLSALLVAIVNVHAGTHHGTMMFAMGAISPIAVGVGTAAAGIAISIADYPGLQVFITCGAVLTVLPMIRLLQMPRLATPSKTTMQIE